MIYCTSQRPITRVQQLSSMEVYVVYPRKPSMSIITKRSYDNLLGAEAALP